MSDGTGETEGGGEMRRAREELWNGEEGKSGCTRALRRDIWGGGGERGGGEDKMEQRGREKAVRRDRGCDSVRKKGGWEEKGM